MTATALAGPAPAAAPLAAPVAPLTWLETAVAVLDAARRPLRAREIVELAHKLGCAPPSRTRTPAQSVNRDLHAALRRGETRVAAGPGPGLFRAAGVSAPAAAPTAPPGPRSAPTTVPRLPIEPLTAMVEARGGLRACGVRHRPGDSREQFRAVERLHRAYLRSRRRGWVSLYDGDELSIRALGLHPCQVWDDGWWEATEELGALAPQTAPVQHRHAS